MDCLTCERLEVWAHRNRIDTERYASFELSCSYAPDFSREPFHTRHGLAKRLQRAKDCTGYRFGAIDPALDISPLTLGAAVLRFEGSPEPS